MTTQPRLPDDDAPVLHPVTGLALGADGATPLSAAARQFNQQLARIDKLKHQLADLEALGTTFRPLYHQQLAPLQARYRQLRQDMVLSLEQRLQGGQLDARQRQTVAFLLGALAEPPVEPDDADWEHLRQARTERQARRDEKRARRAARKVPNAGQMADQAEQEDADAVLRRLYRQLAGALHPDREPDDQARKRKTALMSEVNAAYGRRDLVALMQVQLQAELADAGTLARAPDDRLAALTRLLKAQVADLERERMARQQTLKDTFGLTAWSQVNADDLQQQLLARVRGLEQGLEQIEADLEQVRDDARFRRWLTQQRRLHQADVTDRDAYG